MPRTRASAVAPRPSPTGPLPRGPGHLRTLSSESDPLHQRLLTEQSPRLVFDRRSPRVTQSDPTKQKKLGTRITDLETQLVLAQHELKSLKNQLSSAEVAKKQAQYELTKKGSKKMTATKNVVRRVKPPAVTEIQDRDCKDSPDDEIPETIHPETDVFVVVDKKLVESKAEPNHCLAEDEKEAQSENSGLSEVETPYACNEVASKNEDTSQLKAIVDEKEMEKQVLTEENQTLKQQLEEARSKIAAAQIKEEEMIAKLDQLSQELEASKANEAQLKERLLDAEATKESLGTEMSKMKVQTEQWRKAADAAAAVLASGVETNDRLSERYAAMDNHFNGIFEPPISSFGGYLRSPGACDDTDDDFGRGKKKGSGIRMLGDLWKKKGQK